jgi:tetratricopeptide (TPR) repeat protein
MAAAAPPHRSAPASARPARALLIALLACVLFSAFASGATAPPQESWLQLVLLALTVFAAGAWLYGGGIRISASPAAWAGVALLAAFAVWTGLTILWSVLPDRSWIELNRGLAYVVALMLGIAVGSSLPDALGRVIGGMAIVVAPIALYALGGKTLPGLHVWFLDLDHAGGVTRLRAPLEYWNALALITVFGLFATLRMAADPARATRARMLALAGVYALVVVLGLTYSRGGILALLAGGAAFLALTTERVRTLSLFGGAAVLASLPLTVALTRHDLTTNALPLSSREDDAFVVLVTFLIGLALVLAWGRAVMAGERRLSPQLGRRWGRRAAWAALAVLLLGGLGFVASGAFGKAVDRFADTTRSDRPTDPNRLLSTNSGNRWTWWKEAAGAWSDKPVAGWGAGSFPVTHKRYRTEPLPVQQPHSVPLQWMAETGLVGLFLAGGGLLALLAAALARVRGTRWAVSDAGTARGHAAALFAIPVAWAAHSLYDWDWDIPAVTVPMFVVLGVLVARPARRPAVLAATDGATKGLGYGMAVLLVALAALSAALPALAQTRTNAALESVGRPQVSDTELADASASAELAAKLNPLAVEPLFAAASIAERRGRVDEARRAILRALDRQPDNVDAWFRLTRIEFTRLDRAGVRRAAQRALELDPLNPVAFALARRAQQAAAPPGESATATGTPLPAAP